MLEADKDLMRKTMIAAPCSEKWDDMTGDDRARLCAKCDLHVVNTFMLTDEEVLATLARVHKGERVCMRIYRRPDGTFMTRNCPVGIQKIRERVYKAAVWMAGGLSLMLSLAANALPAGGNSNGGNSTGGAGNGKTSATFKKKPVWHAKLTQSTCESKTTKPKQKTGAPKVNAPSHMTPMMGPPPPINISPDTKQSK